MAQPKVLLPHNFSNLGANISAILSDEHINQIYPEGHVSKSPLCHRVKNMRNAIFSIINLITLLFMMS